MSTRKIKSLIILVLSVILVFELVYIGISKRELFSNDTKIPDTLVISSENVKINNYSITAYEFIDKDNLYISEELLNAYGYSILENEENYTLEHTAETYALTNTVFTDISGYTVKDAEKKLITNDKTYYCYLVNSMFVVPIDALYPTSDVIFSDTLDTLYIAIGEADERERNVAESYAEIIANGGEKTAEIISESNGMTDFSQILQDIKTNSAKYGDTLSNQPAETAKIIVLDSGHGKSSSLMSSDEFESEGYVKNSSGVWGEWRHWKSGTSDVSCEGSGCTGRAPSGGSCWYSAANGNRDIEPDINLNNALAAKKYLEQMGYTVRMTRSSNDENPSFSKRISYCYPNNDMSLASDASIYICIHSNAGGGSGSAYIALEGLYDQKGISSTYVEDSNLAGKIINDHIVNDTSLSQSGSGAITFEPELIAFCKSPVPVAYLEIGFYDNPSDLSILQSESDAIGKAIAEGINEYLN